MSSSNKTANLQLNSWIGTDRPKMADYNSDNEKIDAAFGSHTGDMQTHLSQEDRERLETPVYVGTYFGDGAIEKQSPRAARLRRAMRWCFLFRVRRL